MRECDETDRGLDRVGEEASGIVPFEKERIVEDQSRPGDHGQGDRHSGDLCTVDFDRTRQEPQHAFQTRFRPTVTPARGDPDRPSGQEDEQFRGIRDAVLRIGVTFECVARDVVDVDRHEGEATPEVDRVRFAHYGIRTPDYQVVGGARGGSGCRLAARRHGLIRRRTTICKACYSRPLEWHRLLVWPIYRGQTRRGNLC